MAQEISVQQEEADEGIAASCWLEGNTRRARGCLWNALDLYESLGSAADAARVRAALGELPEPERS
ncbi:hypothetical protein GCM10010483_64950 [Actinokineospora diospyrosa]